MQLTLFSDYSRHALPYLASHRQRRVAVSEIKLWQRQLKAVGA
jgi:hypothetical protein